MAISSNLKPFKKGFDARRGSKPKGTKHLSTLIQEMASDPDFHTYISHPIKGYVEYQGMPIKAIVGTAITRAIAGDIRAMEWLARNGWGKPQAELDNELPQPILNIVHQCPRCNEATSDKPQD